MKKTEYRMVSKVAPNVLSIVIVIDGIAKKRKSESNTAQNQEPVLHWCKAWTYCKRWVRFGGIVREGQVITCKQCKQAIEKQNKEVSDATPKSGFSIGYTVNDRSPSPNCS